MKTLAVTGGTGFVGGHLLRLAVAAGYRVKALTRKPQSPYEGIEWISGSLDDSNSLQQLAEGADAVIHIAGAINAADRDGFAGPNIEGTRHMLAAADAAGARRFIHISSLAAREPELSNYGWSKAESETLVRAAHIDWTIIRPPAVYGPGDGETLELFAMAKRGLVIAPPSGRTSLIHVEDLCALILASLEADAAKGATFEPDDGTTNGLSHVEFGKALGNAFGKSARVISMPAPIVRLGARLDRLFRGEDAKLTPDRARYFCHPDWVVNPALVPPTSLWAPQIPYQKGFESTAKWYLDQGWLD